jgi:hypothetical protein
MGIATLLRVTPVGPQPLQRSCQNPDYPRFFLVLTRVFRDRYYVPQEYEFTRINTKHTPDGFLISDSLFGPWAFNFSLTEY